MTTMWSLERYSCRSSKNDAEPAPPPHRSSSATGTSPRAERYRCRRGWQRRLHYVCALPSPLQRQCSRHHQPDPHVPGLPALPHQALEGLYSHMYGDKNVGLPRGAEPCTPRCREKGNENNHGEDVFIPLTLGNRKRKRLATEGWNTCYWIIVAFNVAPLQVLKGFSVLVPFCTRLENNLQKRAVLARTSWFPRIKKKKKKNSTWSI